jgi:hypothetical protein
MRRLPAVLIALGAVALGPGARPGAAQAVRGVIVDDGNLAPVSAG